MPSDIRAILTSDPDALLREGIGLAVLIAVIVAGFCLPGLA